MGGQKRGGHKWFLARKREREKTKTTAKEAKMLIDGVVGGVFLKRKTAASEKTAFNVVLAKGGGSLFGESPKFGVKVPNGGGGEQGE